MLNLSKSHGLGNDYLVADPANLPFAITPERVKLLCDRHLGPGSDGLLVLDGYEDDGEWFLRIFNPDGSEAEKSAFGPSSKKKRKGKKQNKRAKKQSKHGARTTRKPNRRGSR